MKNCILLLACLCTLNLGAQSLSFDQSTFDKWIETRIGTGKSPAYWYCYGEVYSYPSGQLAAKMEGVDMANMLRINKDSVQQYNRKTFIYTDAKTGQPIYEVDGKPVQHIEYPYQLITYVRRNNQLISYVEQGQGARMTKMGPGSNSSVRKAGNTWVFSSPVFLNFETPRGKYEAYENYDFFFDETQKNTADRYQLTWNRYGDLPPFLGGGKGVIQLVCYRVDKFEQLSVVLQKHIREKAPLWLAPPKDLAEIRKLQQQN
jgi:hypothetical protein